MKPKLNVKLLRQIQKAILSHPDQFMMHSVFSTQLDDRSMAGGCGTAACIAGWAIHFHNGNKSLKQTDDETPGGSSWQEIASKLVGLNEGDSDSLFFEEYWPAKFEVQYRDAETNSGRAKAAAARIDHLIKTGK